MLVRREAALCPRHGCPDSTDYARRHGAGAVRARSAAWSQPTHNRVTPNAGPGHTPSRRAPPQDPSQPCYPPPQSLQSPTDGPDPLSDTHISQGRHAVLADGLPMLKSTGGTLTLLGPPTPTSRLHQCNRG